MLLVERLAGNDMGRSLVLTRRALTLCLLAVPMAAVLFVAASWYSVGIDDGMRARIHAGPFPNQHVSLRAVVGREASALGQPREVTRKLPLRLSILQRDAAPLVVLGETNARGVADFNFTLELAPQAPLQLRLESTVPGDGVVLANGVWHRDASPSWTKGGSLGSAEGVVLTPPQQDLRIRIEEGVLAVPFLGTLSLLNLAAQPRTVDVSLTGATFLEDLSDQRTMLVTPGAMMTSAILPTAHVVEVKVSNGDAAHSPSHAVLPLVPGAMVVTAAGEHWEVWSPVQRDYAYLALVTDEQLLWLDTVPLLPLNGVSRTAPSPIPNDAFAVRGEFKVPQHIRHLLRDTSMWWIASSEADLQAMATVGWPANTAASGEGRRRGLSVVVDGFAQAREQRQKARDGGRLAALGWLSAAFLIEALLLVLYVRSNSTRHVAVTPFLGPLAGRGLWVGLACLILGFAALAYVFWLRA